jgi:hypothetical protein
MSDLRRGKNHVKRHKRFISPNNKNNNNISNEGSKDYKE